MGNSDDWFEYWLNIFTQSFVWDHGLELKEFSFSRLKTFNKVKWFYLGVSKNCFYTFPMTKQMHVSGILPPRSLHNSHLREFTAACLLFILVISREIHHWLSDSTSIFLVLWISNTNICNFFVVFLGQTQKAKILKWNSWRGAGDATCDFFLQLVPFL